MDDCIPIEFDATVVTSIAPYIRPITGLMSIFALALGLAAFKWRAVIDYFQMYDLIYFAVANVLPQDWHSRTVYSFFISNMIFFMLFYT